MRKASITWAVGGVACPSQPCPLRHTHDHQTSKPASARVSEAHAQRQHVPLEYIDATGERTVFAAAPGVALAQRKNIVHTHTIRVPCGEGCPVYEAWKRGSGVGLYPAKEPQKPQRHGPLSAQRVPLNTLAERVVFPTGSNDERAEDAVVLAQRVLEHNHGMTKLCSRACPAYGKSRRHLAGVLRMTKAHFPKSVRPHIDVLEALRQRLSPQDITRRAERFALDWVMGFLSMGHPAHFDGCPKLASGPGVPLTAAEAAEVRGHMAAVVAGLTQVLAIYARRPRGTSDSAAHHEVAEALNAARCWSTWAGRGR